MMLNRSRWRILLILAVLLLLSSIYVAYVEFGQSGLEAISIVASTLLTLSLVVLYREQHQVLRHQQMPQLEISEFTIFSEFEIIQVDISNVGGGPATSMELRIDLYELSGEGPIQTAQGGLRRIESLGDGREKKTRASSIRPAEINIGFEAESKGAIGMGARTRNQDSLASMLAKELDEDRKVIYGKISIEYVNKFSDADSYEADFSLKFTQQDGIEYEIFDFQPWEDDNQYPSLGG